MFWSWFDVLGAALPPPPRWHLFQHKGLQWWTKPLWWKNTFSLWLLSQMSIHVRFLLYCKLQFFGSLFHKHHSIVYTLHKSVLNSVCFIKTLIFEEAKWWAIFAWVKERVSCVYGWVYEGGVCENCVPSNLAVIAKLIRSDCFFHQQTWCFISLFSLCLTFFAWISVFSWWN